MAEYRIEKDSMGDVRVPAGALYGLIGPNGAGKTTVFNLLTGVYQTTGGQMRLASRDLIGLKPHQIAAVGIARGLRASGHRRRGGRRGGVRRGAGSSPGRRDGRHQRLPIP